MNIKINDKENYSNNLESELKNSNITILNLNIKFQS